MATKDVHTLIPVNVLFMAKETVYVIVSRVLKWGACPELPK